MLSGRNALIVGTADDSIVRSITLSLTLHGARSAVAYIAHDDDGQGARRAKSLIDAVQDLGGEALAFPIRTIEPDAVASVVKRVVAAYGTIDLLVSRVGADWNPTAAARMATDDLDAAVQAEIEGTLLCIEACLPVMRENGWGRIVAIGPFEPVCWTHGGVARDARRFLAQQFERRERPRNITANLVHPGWGVIGPGRAEAALAAARHEPAWHSRRQATAQDVADAALFLCGESGRFITGSHLCFAAE